MIVRLLRAATLGLCLVVTTAAIVRGAAPGALTDLESARREVVILQSRLHRALAERDQCRAQLAPVQYDLDDRQLEQAKRTLKAEIERAHEGYVFTLETGALEPMPQPPATPKP